MHRFFNNQMQIDDGSNDRFAAYSDAGGLSMGYYDGSSMKLWDARQAVRAGRQLLHGRVRRLVPESPVPDLRLRARSTPSVDNSPAKDTISQIETDAQGRFVRMVPAAEIADVGA